MDVDSYIDSIARALAQKGRGGGGRATAMIGAGFSRNAEKRTEGARKFPLWRDIVRPLIDELLPPCPECAGGDDCPTGSSNLPEICKRRDHLFKDAAGASGMMALGDKFTAKMGSARLRAALQSAVPDDDYSPGYAHQLLVRLPWADILTTNWDSLLERAVDAYDRSYDKVITVKQIASAIAPRIVKLHGCARSGTDLVFTEESFRTYPKEFAPFVSLVQQSLMENVVVLFGFSGADPNFRAWHGWVRDHLGSNLQPIYMVSLRATEPIDVNLMAGRLITHINLSEKWPRLDDRAKIEKFLTDIQTRLRRLNVNLDWPADHRDLHGSSTGGTRGSNARDWHQRLRSNPGWLVAPAQNRADLIAQLRDPVIALESGRPLTSGPAALTTSNLADDQQHISDNASPEQEKTALIIADSLRIALARPADRTFEILQDILATGLMRRLRIPFEAIAASGDSAYKPAIEQLSEVIEVGVLSRVAPDAAKFRDRRIRSEAALAKSITEIAPTLLGEHHGFVGEAVSNLLPIIEIVEREARLRGNDRTALNLRCILYLTEDNNACELALRGALVDALDQLKLRDIQSLLRLWPDRQYDASSNLRHAAVLREIGKIREAFRDISDTVGRLRSLGNERRRGVAESSREAWAFYQFADLIERNLPELKIVVAPRPNNLGLDDVLDELHERLDELEANRCDPRREMARLTRDLEAAIERARLMYLLPPTHSCPSAASTSQGVVADAANTFVILTEMVGVPINQFCRGHRLALQASRLLAPTNRDLSIKLLLRAGTPEDLPFSELSSATSTTECCSDRPITDIVFDRARARDDFKMLCELLEQLAAPPSDLSSDFIESSYLDQKFRLLQHLIAGLITREAGDVATDLAASAFSLACKIAYSPVVATTQAGRANSLSLFEASLGRFPFGRPGHEILTKLLDLPIPTESNDSIAAGWPDPIRLLAVAWRPKSRGHSDQQAPLKSELTELGKRVIATVAPEMEGNATMRSVLLDHKRRWQSMFELSGPFRKLIVQRRLELIDSLFPMPSSAAVSAPG